MLTIYINKTVYFVLIEIYNDDDYGYYYDCDYDNNSNYYYYNFFCGHYYLAPPYEDCVNDTNSDIYPAT